MTARPKDWVEGSRGGLEIALMVTGGLLVFLAAVMLVQDYAHDIESRAALEAFGQTRTFDPSYRNAFVPYLLAAVAVLSAGTLWRALRARSSPRLRKHGKRFVAFLLTGSGLVDLAYYADTTFGLQASAAVRAIAVVPWYALGGALVVVAAWRLRTLIVPPRATDPEAVL